MLGESLPSLLLLPAPPDPASRSALEAAYRPSLQSVISKLKNLDEPSGSTLIVVIASPVLAGKFRRQQSLSWSQCQSLLAGIYSIISVICANEHVQTETDGGRGSIDARVLFINHDSKKNLPEDFRPAIEPNNTVIVDLATFVSAYHPWKFIFGVDNEAGHQLLSTYLKAYEGMQFLKQEQLIVVEGGLTLKIGTKDIRQTLEAASSFDVVCLGGTFDHLHPGHKLLLTAAVLLLEVPKEGSSQPCLFIVGITGDELLKNKKYADYVQSWDDRAMGVIDFLSSLLELQKDGWKFGHTPKISKKEGQIVASFRDDTILVQCVCIQDAFGPTITREEIDALVVSGETRSGGAAVNERRQGLGWRPLQIFEVNVLDADEFSEVSTNTTDFASKISSTAIRKQRAESST